MDPQLSEIWKHMVRLGRGALSHAVWHSVYYSMDNDMWSELSVLQAAHAAEIFIKARIAQEHPLLIFETIPKLQSTSTTGLSFEDLIEKGRTYQYFDLPDRLWATTGLRIKNINRYESFGKLRNSIQHFANPKRNVSIDAIGFIFEVIDPLINECWGLYAIDHNEDHERYKYVIECLIGSGIPFLVSEDAKRDVKNNAGSYDFDWPENANFRKQMTERLGLKN